MLNICDEKTRLAQEYELATTRLSEAVKNLRVKSEQARLELEKRMAA
jgi:hypothetical protein